MFAVLYLILCRKDDELYCKYFEVSWIPKLEVARLATIHVITVKVEGLFFVRKDFSLLRMLFIDVVSKYTQNYINLT